MQEYFADYLAINPDLYSLNVSAPDWHLFVENSSTWDPSALSRVTEGILSVLLSLKKKPLIRYEKSSILAKKLATELSVCVLTGYMLYATKFSLSHVFSIKYNKKDLCLISAEQILLQYCCLWIGGMTP